MLLKKLYIDFLLKKIGTFLKQRDKVYVHVRVSLTRVDMYMLQQDQSYFWLELDLAFSSHIQSPTSSDCSRSPAFVREQSMSVWKSYRGEKDIPFPVSCRAMNPILRCARHLVFAFAFSA